VRLAENSVSAGVYAERGLENTRAGSGKSRNDDVFGRSIVELTERRAGRAVVLAPAGRIDMGTADQLRERLIPMVTAAA